MVLVGIFTGSIILGMLFLMFVVWRYQIRIELSDKPCSRCGMTPEEAEEHYKSGVEESIAFYGLEKEGV